MSNLNKWQQSPNREHISWNVPYMNVYICMQMYICLYMCMFMDIFANMRMLMHMYM